MTTDKARRDTDDCNVSVYASTAQTISTPQPWPMPVSHPHRMSNAGGRMRIIFAATVVPLIALITYQRRRFRPTGICQ